MKLPRDLSGQELAKALTRLGYAQTRSHIRLTAQLGGEHHVTVPDHNPMRPRTLAKILSEVAKHHKLGRDELLELLFR
ncbi:MAG: type II toxin-antitoxin system HicA family toxin [Thermaceae bacterium]|nr:type II toxin-antitoxin system HicA family toxin [Thermaceae bacterium]